MLSRSVPEVGKHNSWNACGLYRMYSIPFTSSRTIEFRPPNHQTPKVTSNTPTATSNALQTFHTRSLFLRYLNRLTSAYRGVLEGYLVKERKDGAFGEASGMGFALESLEFVSSLQLMRN